MPSKILLIAGIVALQAGCSSYSRDAALQKILHERPGDIPTCTSMTPALTCLRQQLLNKYPVSQRVKRHQVVCVTDPIGEGISSHRAGALLIDALMKVAIPDLLIVVNCQSLYPPGPVPQPVQHLAPALRASVNVEHDAIDVDGDAGLGLSGYGQQKAALARLGLSESESIDLIQVTLQPQGMLGVVQDSISVGAAFVGTRANAVDVGIGGTIAAFQVELSGSASLVQVTSRDQILRYLMEQAVVVLVSRMFNISTPCLGLAATQHGSRELFDRLSKAEKARVEGTLLRRIAAKRVQASDAVIEDGALTECELSWGLAAGLLTKKDLAKLTQLPRQLLAADAGQQRGSK